MALQSILTQRKVDSAMLWHWTKKWHCIQHCCAQPHCGTKSLSRIPSAAENRSVLHSIHSSKLCLHRQPLAKESSFALSGIVSFYQVPLFAASITNGNIVTVCGGKCYEISIIILWLSITVSWKTLLSAAVFWTRLQTNFVRNVAHWVAQWRWIADQLHYFILC